MSNIVSPSSVLISSRSGESSTMPLTCRCLPFFSRKKFWNLSFFLVIIRQAVAGADPYTPLAVGHNNAGDVVGDAVGVVFIVLIYGKCVSVVLVDAVVGGEPHIAELVLRYGEDRAL